MSVISNVNNRINVTNTENTVVKQNNSIDINNIPVLPDRKDAANNLSLNEIVNSKKGIENITVRQNLIAQTKGVGNAQEVIVIAQADNLIGINLRTTVAEQARFERDNHYDRTVGSRIDPQRAADTVPNGTYTEINVPQILAVPRVNDANILTVRPLNQSERNDIQNHSANINRALNEVSRIIQRGVTVNDAPRLTQLSKQIDDLTVRRERLWNRERLSSSAEFNGRIFNATAQGADTSKPPVIFVNGINTDIGRSGTEALELSQRFGVPVQQVINVNEMDRARIIGTARLTPNFNNLDPLSNVEGITAEITRNILSNPVAATSTASAIFNQLDNPSLKGQPIKIVAYSQGGAITAEALRYVDGVMTWRVARGKISRTDADQTLNRIKILGLAPAAVQRDVPAAFRNNYRVVYDRNDPVALGRGVDKTNNVRDLLDLQNRQNEDPNFFLQHLSYFKHYEGTDPGSRFNYRADIEMQRWFAGSNGARGGAVQIDLNNGQFTREVTTAR